MPEKPKTPDVSDAVERQLPDDLALLFAALRSEFHAHNDALASRMQTRMLLFGIPLGAAGGFAAELVRPGSAGQAVAFLFGLF